MAYRLPNLNFLRAFEAAARHRNFTAAAKELSLTSAAISKHVQSLESSLGFLLFERFPRSVELTRRGAAYLPSATQVLDDISASTTELFGLREENSVNIRAPISFSALNLAPRLARFHKEHSNIEVRVGASKWADEVEADSYDIDIRFGNGYWSGYHADLLLDEGFVAVCSPYLYPMPRDLTWMAKGKLISVIGDESAWLNVMRLANIKAVDSHPIIRVDTYLLAIQLAVSAAGALMLPRSMATSYLNSGQLMNVVDLDLPMNGAHYLLRRSDDGRTKPEVAILQQWLVDDYQKEHVKKTLKTSI